MRKSVRLVGLMAGTALVAFLGSAYAGNTMSDGPSANVVDRALNAARIARANGDLNSAASKLAYLVSIAPDNADVLSEYGKVLTEMGQPDEALVYFSRAKAQNSDDWKLYNAEGVAYDEKHDFESARADYAKALKLNPGSTAVLNNAARSRMMAGDLVGAEALIAQARPTAQENAYFTSTQAQLSALELKSNPNAPVAALTPNMDVQTPGMPPSAAPTVPVDAGGSSGVMTPAMSEAAAREKALEMGIAPLAAPQTTIPQPTAAAPVAKTPESSTRSQATPAAQPAVAATVATADASKPVPVVEVAKPAPVVEPAIPAPVVEAPKPAPATDAASQSPALEATKTAATGAAAEQAPATPATTNVTSLTLSAAAQREAALEAGVEPPPIAPVANASAVQTPSAASATTAPSVATTEQLYIRIGMFRSRAHARHVAARLRPHDVHVTRLTWHGRHWYRVWIRGAGDRPKVQDELASVRSLGYLHAHIIAKVETGRRMAQSPAATVVASSGQ